MRFHAWLARFVDKVLGAHGARRAAAHVAAASLTTVVASNVQAQSRPAPASAGRDTVHRYHEKFVLTPSDSVVVRTDSVWYPRSGVKAVPLVATPTTDTTTRRPASGSTGGHQSHASHASHSSHRSMVGYRRGH
jgi:hypothetical protein